MTRRDQRTPTPSGPTRKGSRAAWALALGLTATVAVAGASAAQSPSSPTVLTDDEGTQVTLESPPERVVSLSPANSEIVFALGPGTGW